MEGRRGEGSQPDGTSGNTRDGSVTISHGPLSRSVGPGSVS